MTPAEIQARGAQLGQQIADAMELRVLRNLIGMHDAGVPVDQIQAYLELEREQIDHWLEHELPDQALAWVTTWLDASSEE